MLTFGFYDVDRIEILKGPQGDLYGRNTTAGAVNIISRKPSSVTDIRLEAGFGSYESWHLDGAVGGALTSTLNARFARQTIQQGSGPQPTYVPDRKSDVEGKSWSDRVNPGGHQYLKKKKHKQP